MLIYLFAKVDFAFLMWSKSSKCLYASRFKHDCNNTDTFNGLYYNPAELQPLQKLQHVFL